MGDGNVQLDRRARAGSSLNAELAFQRPHSLPPPLNRIADTFQTELLTVSDPYATLQTDDHRL